MSKPNLFNQRTVFFKGIFWITEYFNLVDFFDYFLFSEFLIINIR